jgi:hypothetical protein
VETHSFLAGNLETMDQEKCVYSKKYQVKPPLAVLPRKLRVRGQCWTEEGRGKEGAKLWRVLWSGTATVIFSM